VRSLAVLIVPGALTSCRLGPPPLAVHHEKLGSSWVTAVNLRPEDGVFLRSSNKLTETDQITVGTPAKISKFTSEGVDIEMRHVTYTMVPSRGEFDDSDAGIEAFLAKYFKASDGDASIESLGPAELADEVRVGRVLKGMTKEQVFVALGPPEWVGEPKRRTVDAPNDAAVW